MPSNHFNIRLSGLLTARFLLHLRRYSDVSIIDKVHDGGQSSGSESANGSVSSFRAQENTAASSLNDFGEDPVARVKKVNTNSTRDVEANTMVASSSFIGLTNMNAASSSSANKVDTKEDEKTTSGSI